MSGWRLRLPYSVECLGIGSLTDKCVLKDVTASKAFFLSKTSKRWDDLSWANGKKKNWGTFIHFVSAPKYIYIRNKYRTDGRPGLLRNALEK